MNDKFKKKQKKPQLIIINLQLCKWPVQFCFQVGSKRVSVFVRCSKRILLGLSASKSSFSYTRPHSSSNKALKVICCNSDDQCWRNNTSALLHQLRSYLPLPSAPPHIPSLFPHCDCFLYFITPWHQRSIDALILLCHSI